MRINIARYETFKGAQELKMKLVEEYPDKVFQTRARKDGYYVVERKYDPSKPSETQGPSKRRKRKRHGITF